MTCEVSFRPLKSPNEAPRVLQVIPVAGRMASQADNHYPGLNVTAQLSPSRENAHHGPYILCEQGNSSAECYQTLDVLHIRFHGGYYVNRAQTADLQFFCDHAADEVCSQRGAFVASCRRLTEFPRPLLSPLCRPIITRGTAHMLSGGGRSMLVG